MKNIQLEPGMFFVTRNPMALGRAIMAIERVWAKDNEATYSHAGIVTDPEGTTLEALWRIQGNSLDAYKGERVMIGRWTGMNEATYWKGIDAIKEHVGQIYPFWRLPLFLVPIMAKYVSLGRFAVCSELTTKFLLGAGFASIGEWRNQTPDDVAELIDRDRDVIKVFEGVWE